MKNPLLAKLESSEAAVGLWITAECPSISEIAVLLGLDWVCLEMEHGPLGFKELANHMRVTRGSKTSPIVRVPALEMEPIRRTLDIGAHGVIVPMISSRAELERAMSYAHYPPHGVRGIGGERALKYGLGMADYVACANEEILVIPLIETRQAVENAEEILDTPGLRAIFFGSVDMSASYGHPGQWAAPGVAERILEIRAKAEQRGISAGIMGPTREALQERHSQGFRLLSLGTEAALLIHALSENLRAIGREPECNLWF